ncbi:hypothetical protein, partial [Tannerella forsythia]
NVVNVGANLVFALFLCGVGLSERKFRKWAHHPLSFRTPPFVIPNIVRNLAREKNEILRFALNDKLIVNCQWLIVMPGTRNPNATLCHSEHREESREGKEKRFFASL